MNTFSCLIGLVMLGLALAQGGGKYNEKNREYSRGRSYKADEYHQSSEYGEEKGDGYGDDKKSSTYKGGRYYYGGKYAGKCGPDGLYYRDEYSFVLCSNSKGYVQPCAPGTRNSGYNDYAPGYYYGYSDFCDVNLVDYGYSAPKYGPGYSEQPAYGFQAYRYPAGASAGASAGAGAGYGPKSPSPSYGNRGGYGRFEGAGYGGQASQGYQERQSYGQEYSGHEQSSYRSGGHKNDGYQTRTGYDYKDGAKH